MKRRFLTLALALALALSLAAVPSLAAGETAQVYTNMSAAAVNDFGTQPHAEAFRPLIVVEDADLLLERVSVYHWNGGAGAAPGTVSVYDNATRQLVGTWQATGREGNTWWDVFPNVELEVRKAYVIDCSDRQTWSFGGDGRPTFAFAAYGYHLPAPVPPIDLAMYSYPNCSVVVNGTPVQWSAQLPYIDTNSRSMAMLAPIAQALGLTVEWDEYLWEARFSDGVDTLAFPIGSSCAHADNGAVIHMDTMAAVRDGDIFTPIRCLAEFFGWTVEWGDSYKTVYITG